MSNKVEVTVMAPATSELSKDEHTSETHDKEEATHDLAKETLNTLANQTG